LLKEETDPKSESYKDLEMIVEQADRCKRIVGGLLNFARKNQVKKDNCNLSEFVNRSFSSIIIPSNISVQLISNLYNPVAQIDSDQMMQVITNLEKNAIEAMPGGGNLLVELNGDDDTVVLNISDTGTGISKENMDKIFTPFFTTKELGKGTGLGLPLIYGIVKMHNGKIAVKSNDDQSKGHTGTSFTITLPRKG
jgi:signal transduction histidine kinase